MKRTLLPLLLLLAASCQKEATTLPAHTSTDISNASIVRDTIKFDQGYAGTLVQHNDDAILLSATFNDLKGKTLYIDKLVYRIHHTTDAHPKHLYINRGAAGEGITGQRNDPNFLKSSNGVKTGNSFYSCFVQRTVPLCLLYS
jgi:hypothetical protein